MKSNSVKFARIVLLPIILLLSISLTSCYTIRERMYYSEKDNYINVTGTVNYIVYNDDHTALYFEFSDLNPEFGDNCFKIVGKNLMIVQENGIDKKIELGDEIQFITAPRYFGDGYVMPIVGISVDGETLLDFEQGYDNFLEWLK